MSSGRDLELHALPQVLVAPAIAAKSGAGSLHSVHFEPGCGRSGTFGCGMSFGPEVAWLGRLRAACTDLLYRMLRVPGARKPRPRRFGATRGACCRAPPGMVSPSSSSAGWGGFIYARELPHRLSRFETRRLGFSSQAPCVSGHALDWGFPLTGAELKRPLRPFPTVLLRVSGGTGTGRRSVRTAALGNAISAAIRKHF